MDLTADVRKLAIAVLLDEYGDVSRWYYGGELCDSLST